MQPRCARCRYLLVDLPAGPCPECGHPFNPSDPSTLFSPPPAALALAGARPPRWLLIAHASLVTPLVLFSSSPSRHMCEEAAMIWLIVLGLPILVWLLALLAHLSARAELALAGTRQPRWSIRWLMTPALLAAAIALQASGVIWKARWAIARPALEAALANPQFQQGMVAGFSIRVVSRETDGTTTLMLGFPDSFYSDAPPRLIFMPDPCPWVQVPLGTDLGNNWQALVDHS
jgi:hypothetical protein